MSESLISLISVVALLLGSPGPAPIALAAVGASFGVLRGLGFLLGILSGLVVAIIFSAFGLSTLFVVYPQAKAIVQLIGGLYILYVAFKIATAPVIGDVGKHDRAPVYMDGFILNLLNPKAYAAFLAIFSQFLLPLENTSLALLSTGLVCLFVASIVDAAWLVLGGAIRPIFGKPLQVRILRLIFAALMIFAVTWAMFS